VGAARGTATVRVFRGEAVESRHRVHVAVFADGALRSAAGDPDEVVFLRSAAKPFQAAAMVGSGALDRFGATEEVLALVAASHSGEAVHTRGVAGLLRRLGLDERSLACGVHPPFDPTVAREGEISQLHHNCSGKHAGMLALALHLGVSPADYLDPQGPVQRRILDTVARAAGLAAADVVIATDGCSAPTFALPLRAAARAFSLLARPEKAPAELRSPLRRVVEAMVRHPYLVAGTGRFDTRLMIAMEGRLVAKGGAEGVEGIADRENGVGIVLKVADGAARAVAPAVLELLRQLGCSTPEALEIERRPVLTNHAGKAVGRIEADVVLEPAG
jgi:L-asparaginase II